MNNCTFCGRLVADAEMKTARSGTELCSFRIASDVGWGDQKKTHWLSCVIFGERGQKLQPYLRKGDPITVVGELSPPRTYEAQGEMRVAQDLVVREIALQGAKSDSSANQSNPTTKNAQRPPRAAQAAQGASGGGSGMNGDFDDAIPFQAHERGWCV